MKNPNQSWEVAIILVLVSLGGSLYYEKQAEARPQAQASDVLERNMLPIQFDFQVREDRRGITFEGLEAGHPDLDGALNLHLRVALDHLVLSLWPVKGEITQIYGQLGQFLGPPRSAMADCGLGDCMDDKEALQQTTRWDFDPATRPEVLEKVKALLGLQQNGVGLKRKIAVGQNY